ADRNRSHWSTSKTPSYTKSVSWQHHQNYLMVINEYPYRNTHIGINDFTEYQLTQENKIERVFNPHEFKKDNF
ncbi:hypothetical protein EXX46_18030, partial [Escherichia coli]